MSLSIVQITPGAGGMYCGNCFRDNALVGELRKRGHHTLMVPLYLPMTLDEDDQSAGTPIFFSGINVYLEQKLPWFRRAPHWFHQMLTSPRLLKWAAGRAAKTKASDVGELTISMLRGEEGNQARELELLIGWLKQQKHPDVICLSNALLMGLVRKLREELNSPVICMLQGEDSFLDGLPEGQREEAWRRLAGRACEVDCFIAPTKYFGDRMRERLHIPPEKVRIVYNGIDLEGFGPAETPPSAPVLGYFARMCPEKGLDTLVEVFIRLKQRNRIQNLKLKVGGGCGPGELPFVKRLQAQLRIAQVHHDVEFLPNLDRDQKIAFFKSISLLCTPALYGEAFGLYIVEAMAAGIPVVQPRHASFPELIEATCGGLLVEPGKMDELVKAIENLLLNPERCIATGAEGRKAVHEKFSLHKMATEMENVFREVDQQFRRKAGHAGKREPRDAPLV